MTEMDDMNARIMEEFRANGGVVGGDFEGAPLLILHTSGAKSGKPNVQPLMYQAVGDGFAIFASYAGGPRNPGWYHNLVAGPKVSIEVGADTVEVTARVVDGGERDRIWTRQKSDYPFFADYEQQTSRTIPVVVLERRA